jgi:DNA-binding response OmpR family regulator
MLPAKSRPYSSDPHSHHEQRVGRRGTEAGTDTRILIVDHDRRIGTMLAFMLEARGYGEVRTVRTAARAESIFGLFQPGIVFLDLALPDADTFRLAAQLQRIAQLRRFRLIALTDDVAHDLREEARVAGFERYLVKPVSQVELDKILFIPVAA